MRIILILALLLVTVSANSYNRAEYGVWRDLDKNCKSTRIDILEKTAIKVSSVSCKNIKGVWRDFYTNRLLYDVAVIDIDHVIPLSYADSIGANNWNVLQKVKFANDADNLVITHRTINRQKGAKGLSKWLPKELNVKCEYLLKWVQVTNKYNLTLPNGDKVILERYKPFCEKVSSAM